MIQNTNASKLDRCTRWLRSGAILLALTLQFVGCAAPRMYIVSVVEKSQPMEPAWVTEHQPGRFVGIAEDQSKQTAQRKAMEEVLAAISREIGVELSMQASSEKSETEEGINDCASVSINEFANALLFDIGRRVTNSYWEHCRAQTGKELFNDFYRFYICAEVDSGFIDTLRTKTLEENERRTTIVAEYLSQAEAALICDPPDLSTALRQCGEAITASSSLFYGRQAAVDRSVYKLTDMIRSVRIITESPYSEVRPERHEITYRVEYKGHPIEGVKVGFQLVRGEGYISPPCMTDEAGQVTCNLETMRSQIKDNRLVACLDLEECGNAIDRIDNQLQVGVQASVQQAARSIANMEVFSTLAKRAKVTAGSLRIANVNWGFEGVFRRVKGLKAIFYLNEHNGRSVTFDKYSVKVTVWFEVPVDLFSSKIAWDWKEGNYALEKPVELTYLKQEEITIDGLKAVAGLINELKANHEIGMRQIKIEMTLQGYDDAGNSQEVDIGTDALAWKSLFEK